MDRTTTLKEILAANPTDAFARYGLAMALTAAGDPEAALTEYATILTNTPDYVPAYQMSAQQLLKLNRPEEARTRLEAGLAAADRTSNAHAASEMRAMLDEIF